MRTLTKSYIKNMNEDEVKKKIKKLVSMERPLKKSIVNYQKAIKQIIKDLDYLGEIFDVEHIVDRLKRVIKEKQKIENRLMSIQINKQFLKSSLDPYEGDCELSYAYGSNLEPMNEKLEKYPLEDDIVFQYEFYDSNNATINKRSYKDEILPYKKNKEVFQELDSNIN